MAYDASIIDAIREEASKVSDPSKRRRYERAALQTGIVETGLQNLPNGDADSEGWRQERKSLYKNPTNVKASVHRFFQEAAQLDKGQPSWQLAADVQRPAAQYRGRYKEVAQQAAQLAGGATAAASTATDATEATDTPDTPSAISMDVPGIRAPEERVKQEVTGPALPGYVKARVAQAAPVDSDTQAPVRAAIAKLVAATPQAQALTVPGTQTAQTTTTRAAAPSSGGKAGSKVLELIFNDGGKGYGIKDGQTVSGSQVFSDVWGGHANHVHVAAGPKTVVALGKAAQRMGLHVGENPSFGGENPASHVPGSYHNKAEAIDVSAPMDAAGKKLMSSFAKYVANYNKTKRLPA